MNFKFSGSNGGQANAVGLFDALLGKPQRKRCPSCNGVVPEDVDNDVWETARCRCTVLRVETRKRLLSLKPSEGLDALQNSYDKARTDRDLTILNEQIDIYENNQ